MPTPSANLSETPISGKYGRVLVSYDGTLYPYNFKTWQIQPATEDLDTTGFEDAGWGNGLTGIVRARVSLAGPYQIGRGTGLPSTGAQILTPGRRVVYELWVVHPDYASYGTTLRFTGVAQVTGNPTENDVERTASLSIELASRGPIYLPGQAAPAASAQLAVFQNVSGGGAMPS